MTEGTTTRTGRAAPARRRGSPGAGGAPLGFRAVLAAAAAAAFAILRADALAARRPPAAAFAGWKPLPPPPSERRSEGRRRLRRDGASAAMVAVDPRRHRAGGEDRSGFEDGRNGQHREPPPFDGRKSPFGSAALGKRRLPTLVSLADDAEDRDGPTPQDLEDLLSLSPSTSPPDAATADLLLRRDRALLALQQHLGLNTTASLSILTDFPELYDAVKCPSLSSKLLYLLNVVNLPKKRLCHMMLTKPTLTTRVVLDSEARLISTIEVLQTELGLTSSDILEISSGRLPAVLRYDRSQLRRRIRAYRHDLGYPPDVLKRMVLRNPEILRTDGAWVKRSAEVLGEELGLGLEDVHRMVGRANLALTYDPEGNVRPTVQYLKGGTVGRCLGLVKRKGVSAPLAETEEEAAEIVRERVREFVLKFPQVLGLSVGNNLRPTLDFFLQEVGVAEAGLGRMLTRRPALLELKVDLMRGKLAFLREELGVDGAQLAEMVVRFPELLTLSIEDNLRPKIAYFRGEPVGMEDAAGTGNPSPLNGDNADPVSVGLGMNATQLRSVFASKPQIFSLNLERNIRPKVGYLTRSAGLSAEDVRHWWASYPQTVMCSLDTLIRPRMELIQGAGLRFLPRDTDRSQVPLNFVWKPKKNWEGWVRVHVEGEENEAPKRGRARAVGAATRRRRTSSGGERGAAEGTNKDASLSRTKRRKRAAGRKKKVEEEGDGR